MPHCTVIPPGGSYTGRHDLTYAAGVSAEPAGARAISMHLLTMPPGTRARAHLHADHESSIYVVSGRVESWSGPRLERHAVVEAGDFVHIPAGVPHLPANTGDVPAEAVIARTDPNEHESVVPLPELDALEHLPPRPAASPSG